LSVLFTCIIYLHVKLQSPAYFLLLSMYRLLDIKLFLLTFEAHYFICNNC